MTNATKRLTELASRGGSAAQIADTLKAEGFKTSRSTVGRALRELRGSQRVGRRPTVPADRPAAVSEPTPSAPTDDTTDPRTLDGLLEVARRALSIAEKRGDLAALARFGNLATAILEAKRKAEPPDVMPEGVFVTADEMKASSEQGKARLVKAVHGAIEEKAKWPTCSSCRSHVPPADIQKRLADMPEVSRLFVSLML